MKKTFILGASLALVLAGATSCGGNKNANNAEEAAAAKTDTLTYSTDVFGEETAQAVYPVDEEGYISVERADDEAVKRLFGEGGGTGDS